MLSVNSRRRFEEFFLRGEGVILRRRRQIRLPNLGLELMNVPLPVKRALNSGSNHSACDGAAVASESHAGGLASFHVHQHRMAQANWAQSRSRLRLQITRELAQAGWNLFENKSALLIAHYGVPKRRSRPGPRARAAEIDSPQSHLFLGPGLISDA